MHTRAILTSAPPSRLFLSPGSLGVSDNLDTSTRGFCWEFILRVVTSVGRIDGLWSVEGAEERRRQSDLDGKAFLDENAFLSAA